MTSEYEQKQNFETMKKTAMQELIEWCKSNAMNDENQAGVKLIMIDYEELKEKFDDYLAIEKQQLIDSHIAGQKFGCNNDELDSEEYFNKTFCVAEIADFRQQLAKGMEKSRLNK